MNKRFDLVATWLCLLLAATYTVATPVRADEQSELLISLEQRLQKSEGSREIIEGIANEVVERRADVATLIVMYASRNLIQVATEAGQPPVTMDLAGKTPLPFDPNRKDAGVSQIVVVLITALAPGSEFRRAITSFIGQAGKTASQAQRTARIAELLVRTVANYSVQALFGRLKVNRKNWPFPLCLPNCEGE
jgi:hypothetical protein